MRYAEGKAKARNEAIEWQYRFSDNNYRKKGKRYGLLREFRENGIC